MRSRATTVGAPASARRQLRASFDAAIAALDPVTLIGAAITREPDALVVGSARGPRFRIPLTAGVIVVGAGKAAAALAHAVGSLLGDALVGGVVIVPDGYERDLDRVTVLRGGHPVPTRSSVTATNRLLACIGRHPGVPAIVLLTGGASSLLVKPAPGLTLTDKRRTTRLLLASGADITELNTVRKHLSAVKGGRLGALLTGRLAVTLVVSDVPGDDLTTIGSGPTVADPTTFVDARRVLAAHGLLERVPAAVRRHIERGVRGHAAETPKRAAPSRAWSHVIRIADNRTARRGAIAAARREGMRTIIELQRPLTGSPADAARAIARRIVACQRSLGPSARALIVGGGETTVTLGRRHGRGGRNQELALEVSSLLAGRPGWMLLAAGTDGIDGPTSAAGAYADGESARRAERTGGSIGDALRRHDVFPLLAAMGDHFAPGPTMTNVADLVLVMVWQPRSVA